MIKLYLKKSKALLSLLMLTMLLFAFKANAQCPPGNVTFTTQAEVDQFIIDYPNCTTITGYVAIGNQVVNLNGLSNITEITGSLAASYATALADISGLSNLTTIGQDFDLSDTALTNLDGLNSLTSIGGFLNIFGNPVLTNLNGLANLESITLDIYIESNIVLTDISALQYTSFNPDPAAGYGLTIINNSALAVCNLSNFCTYLANPASTHPRQISGNLAECVNEAAVIAACATPQCPPGNVTFTTQAEVDQFIIDYPNCTTITGYVSIRNQVVNLNGLSNLTQITSSIDANNATALVNISGLSNLTSVGQDVQFVNTALTNIDGLSSLASVGGYLLFRDNAALTNLDGLDSLTTIGGRIEISNNAALTNIDGLSSLASVGGYLLFRDNAALTNLDGLSSLASVGGYLLFGNNAALTNLNGLSSLASVSGNLVFENNAALTNLSGLDNLTTIGGSIEIFNNVALTNLNALNNITSISGYLFIKKNDALTTLNGLNNLANIGGDIDIQENAVLDNVSALQNTAFAPYNGFGLTILNNPALAVCNLPNFCSYLTNPASTHPRQISGNLAECVNEAAVIAACTTPQCPPGNVTFTTQAEVDQFIIDYPNCTQITGWLKLQVNSGTSDITDLSGLSNIVSVGGNLEFNNITLLENVNDLSNLTTVGGSLAFANTGIMNIEGLNSLQSIGGYIWVDQNPQLQSLDGLNNVATVQQTIYIKDNATLNDISALQNTTLLNPVNGYGLTILNNPALAVCNLLNFCSYLANPSDTHPRVISGNLAECANEAAVIAACTTPQCPPGNVTFTTQAEVDQFIIDYPNCTTITGYVAIGNQVVNLNGLSNLTAITISIDAGNATALVNISGLSNLTSVGQDVVFANTALTNLNGLSSLASVGEDLIFADNTALTNLNGLSSLASVGEDLIFADNAALTNVNGLSSLTTIGGSIEIYNNVALTNLIALNNLTSISGYLFIKNNDALTTLNGLNNLANIGGDIDIQENAVLDNVSALQNTAFAPYNGFGLTILNNPALAVCNLPNFCSYLTNPASTHPRSISGNLTTCLDATAVQLACESLSVSDIDKSNITVYPNPTANVVNIANLDNALTNIFTFADLNGRIVKTVKFAGVTEAQVNISELSAGVYMMTISSDKAATTKKIIKN